MDLLFTLVAAPLLGLLVRPRATAVAIYLAGFAITFTHQSVSVLLEWFAGTSAIGTGAFGPTPNAVPIAYSSSEVWGYGVVNLVIVLAGVGMVIGVGALRARRAERRSRASVSVA